MLGFLSKKGSKARLSGVKVEGKARLLARWGVTHNREERTPPRYAALAFCTRTRATVGGIGPPVGGSTRSIEPTLRRTSHALVALSAPGVERCSPRAPLPDGPAAGRGCGASWARRRVGWVEARATRTRARARSRLRDALALSLFLCPRPAPSCPPCRSPPGSRAHARPSPPRAGRRWIRRWIRRRRRRRRPRRPARRAGARSLSLPPLPTSPWVAPLPWAARGPVAHCTWVGGVLV
jgi:hypothetical protein